MVVRKEDIHNFVERLPEDDQKTIFDFIQYLLNRSTEKPNGLGGNRSGRSGR